LKSIAKAVEAEARGIFRDYQYECTYKETLLGDCQKPSAEGLSRAIYGNQSFVLDMEEDDDYSCERNL